MISTHAATRVSRRIGVKKITSHEDFGCAENVHWMQDRWMVVIGGLVASVYPIVLRHIFRLRKQIPSDWVFSCGVSVLDRWAAYRDGGNDSDLHGSELATP